MDDHPHVPRGVGSERDPARRKVVEVDAEAEEGGRYAPRPNSAEDGRQHAVAREGGLGHRRPEMLGVEGIPGVPSALARRVLELLARAGHFVRDPAGRGVHELAQTGGRQALRCEPVLGKRPEPELPGPRVPERDEPGQCGLHGSEEGLFPLPRGLTFGAVGVRTLDLPERATAADAPLPPRVECVDAAYEGVTETHDLRGLLDLDLQRRAEQQLRAAPLGRFSELSHRGTESLGLARLGEQCEPSTLQRRGAPRGPTGRLTPLDPKDRPVERRQASLEGIHQPERRRPSPRARPHRARKPGGHLSSGRRSPRQPQALNGPWVRAGARGLPSLAKGARFRVWSRRGSWVQIPLPAPSFEGSAARRAVYSSARSGRTFVRRSPSSSTM